MIRRHDGEGFLLITQVDHAALAAELAARVGNGIFARLGKAALTAIRLHDSGWPLHDDEPTLNAGGLPTDVFETPKPIDLMVWAASADRAQAVDPYAGLLVSLHSLALSIHATASTAARTGQFDPQKMHDQFAVNKFQHREIERQEQLRRQLGMDESIPLKHGLAELRASADEDRVLFDFRMLQAMDLISLCLCCSRWPQDHADDVLQSVGGDTVTLKLRRYSETEITVTPWPFDVQRIELTVPYRRLPAKPFGSVEDFCTAYRTAAVEALCLGVAV
jgi:hypothetical protein